MEFMKDAPATIQATITELIKRKKKMDKLEKREKITNAITTVLFVIIFFDAIYFVFFSSGGDPFTQIVNYISYPKRGWFILGSVISLGLHKDFKRNFDKKEDKYKKLVAEVVTQTQEYWPRIYSKSEIDELLKHLKKNYKINLYYHS